MPARQEYSHCASVGMSKAMPVCARSLPSVLPAAGSPPGHVPAPRAPFQEIPLSGAFQNCHPGKPDVTPA